MAKESKNLAVGAFMLLILTANCLTAGGQDDPEECSQNTAIDQFLEPESALLGYVANADRARIRMHEWGIFSALINNGHPLWEDWDSKCELGLATVGCQDGRHQTPAPAIRGLEFPVELIARYRATSHSLVPGSPFKFDNFMNDVKKGPLLASVRFNPEAACHIRQKQLSTWAQLSSLLQDHLAQPQDASRSGIPPFEKRSSMAVKLDWEFLQEVPVQGGGTKYYLQLFDPQMKPQPSDSYSLTLNDAARTEISVGPDCQENDYIGTPVPLSCFYSLPVTDLTLPANQLLIILGHQNLDHPGNHYVVLVGIHITTKEIPEWTWGTFYWSKRAFETNREENMNRLPSIKSPWSHYSVAATFDSENPPDLARKGPPIASSPYLEGQFDNGVSSNCLFCHRLASYSARPPRSPFTVGAPPYKDRKTPIDHAQQAAFLNDSLTTDFFWSLGDLNGAQEQDFLDKFKQYFNEQVLVHPLKAKPSKQNRNQR